MYFCALPIVLCLRGLFLQAQVTDWIAPVASAVRACDRQHVRWRCACGLFKNTKAGKRRHDVCQGIQSDCSKSPDGGWGPSGKSEPLRNSTGDFVKWHKAVIRTHRSASLEASAVDGRSSLSTAQLFQSVQNTGTCLRNG